ncbi:MAG: phosphatase PAP2 family protein [Anaerolineae bacterium]|nr:phosphatase PAP2 family protein [Gemmatimonadaceae bacterium]
MRSLRIHICAVAVTVLPVSPILWMGSVPADAQATDSTRRSQEPLFTSRDAIVAVGFAGIAAAAIPLDRSFGEYLQGAPQTNRFFKRVAVTVEAIAEPGAFFIGGALYAAGRLSDNERMADLGLHGTEAIVIGLAITSVIKYAAGRARPFVDNNKPHDFEFGRGFKGHEYRSFPSGHSLIGFAAAAVVTDEARRWRPESVWYVGPAMYGGALLIGASRMYDNRHWASDVIVGAAIGIVSGRKIVRYHHTHPDNRIDRWLLGVSISNGAGGRQTRLIVMPER